MAQVYALIYIGVCFIALFKQFFMAMFYFLTIIALNCCFYLSSLQLTGTGLTSEIKSINDKWYELWAIFCNFEIEQIISLWRRRFIIFNHLRREISIETVEHSNTQVPSKSFSCVPTELKVKVFNSKVIYLKSSFFFNFRAKEIVCLKD